ncbi:unnamed protein product [Rhizoctonia solani]|uniref:Uncharacterized protein n=1 Tax=Rhizoctonia solani TaxID=456999 RepID=A0A8H2WQ16_9AGAM|nr:unnamed protein product [Rhizoctonia solani]
MPLRFDLTTISHFANPSIASGCIKLLKVAVSRATDSDSESPLGYEYGMLCISIIISCLDLCLLERLDELEETLVIGDKTPELPTCMTFSTIAAREIFNQLVTLSGIEDYEWSGSANHRRCTPLLAPQDALDLMNMLWDDRWFLLMDFGLSSIFFALFQYISHEYHSRKNPNGTTLYNQLYELIIRSLVAANKRDQSVALRILAECGEYTDWTPTSKHTDVLDSQLIMTAFIRQISQGLDSKALNLEPESPLKMLQFVALATDPGSQDLLPKVIECTINIGWSWLLDQDDQIELSPDLLFDALGMLIKPVHTPPYQLLPSVQAQIIDTLRSTDFLDLTAQLILRLDPTKPDITIVTFDCMLYFYQSLEDAVSRFALGQKFWDYVPVWRKFKNHLYTNHYGMTSVINSERDDHFRLCMKHWFLFARLVGLEPAIRNSADDEFVVNVRKQSTVMLDVKRWTGGLGAVLFPVLGCVDAIWVSLISEGSRRRKSLQNLAQIILHFYARISLAL